MTAPTPSGLKLFLNQDLKDRDMTASTPSDLKLFLNHTR